MKIFRYKKYDFDRDLLPLGFTDKPKEVIALESPGEDYEEYVNLEYMIALQESAYEESETAGTSFVRKIASTLKVYAQLGTISTEEANLYGTATNPVSMELKKGWWHSAYYEHIKIVPPKNLES